MADQEALVRSTFQASAAIWPFTAISSILFGMKLYSRLRLLKEAVFGWEDLVISLSWILNIVRAAVFQKALVSTRKISSTNPSETIPTAAFWVIFTDAWAFLSIALPKLGIGILIIRLFRPHRWLKVSILTLCIALNVLAVAGFTITLLQCDPVAGQWDPFRYPKARCWDRDIQLIYSCAVSGISAFTDIAFSIYPSIVVWALQMPTWKKISTMALMGLGVASFAFAVTKLVSNTTLLGNPDVNSILYDGIHIGIWNSIENDFVLSAACLPSVPPFFRACKLFVKTRITLYTRWTHPASFTTLTSPGHSGRRDHNEFLELAHSGEPRDTNGSKTGNGYSWSK